MSWTYSGDPSSSPKDAVRFEIPDTEEASPLLQDEEIEYALTQEGESVLAAAAHCCEQLARKLSLQADTAIGSVKANYKDAAKNMAARAEDLRKRASGRHAPFAGGISRSEKEAREAETDRVVSPAKLGQFQWPGGGEGQPPNF
jgi:hypothetical protein